MHAASGGHAHFEKKLTVVQTYEWCLCLQLVNKVKRIIVFMRIHEMAFWKKGMFCDGESQSFVRILQSSENFSFCCCVMPIIITSMPIAIGYGVQVSERIILFVDIMNQ